MSFRKIGPALALTAAVALGGCASYGDGGYGYSRASVGYRSYDAPYYGWYNDYYYPGVGYYVYDRRGSRHRWNDHQRHYWQGRGRGHHRSENWSGYRGDHRQWSREHRRDDRRDWNREHRRDDRRDWGRNDRRDDHRSERWNERREDHRRGSGNDQDWGSKRFGTGDDRHRPR